MFLDFFTVEPQFCFRSSARIGTLLEQLQKLCLAGSEAKYEQEKVDVEQLRYVTNKIQQLLSSQGNYYLLCKLTYSRIDFPKGEKEDWFHLLVGCILVIRNYKYMYVSSLPGHKQKFVRFDQRYLLMSCSLWTHFHYRLDACICIWHLMFR